LSKYEQVLNKIAPVFFKFIRYNEYVISANTKFRSYIKSMSLPEEYETVFTHSIFKEMDYLYYCSWYSKYKYPEESNVNFDLIYEESVLLTTTNKILSTHYEDFTIDNFIVNIIINKFSFENMPMYYAPFLRFADFFIILVGKDTYDAIRKNIK